MEPTPTTIVYEDRPPVFAAAVSSRAALWLPLDELPAITGWEVEAGGVCRGDACVPLPRGREHELVQDGRLDLAALAAILRQPVVHDVEAGAWAFGVVPPPVAPAGDPLEAPDVELPDRHGRRHALSDYRGTKVLLLSWASW